MAAGLGFKTFATGDVLTAADTNGYLMQGVLVFASAAARDAAITSPQAGQTAYLKDSNTIVSYSGSAWVTKSASSPLTTKGDLYTYSTTDARLPVGTNGQVLTAASGQATGLQWATPSSGSMTQLATGTVSGTSVTLSSISQSYTHLYLVLSSVQLSAATDLAVRPNNDTGANYQLVSVGNSTSVGARTTDTLMYLNGGNGVTAPTTANNDTYTLLIQNYTSSKAKNISYSQSIAASTTNGRWGWCNYATTTAISSLVLCTSSGSATWSVGTYTLYGVN
jgi:hypothetical protein